MKNKRFIAGASCPQCQKMDVIFTYEEGGEKWQACASCDFKQAMSEVWQQELPTRVNQHRPGEKPLAHEMPVEVVNLVDVGKKKK